MISGLINRVKELGQELTLLTSDINEEKIKNEAGAAHAIERATVHPLIADDLKNMPLVPSGAKDRETNSQSEIKANILLDKKVKESDRYVNDISFEPDGNG